MIGVFFFICLISFLLGLVFDESMYYMVLIKKALEKRI